MSARNPFLLSLALALGLALAACKPQGEPPAAATPAAGAETAPAVAGTAPTGTAADASTAATSCPDADFDAFLKRFSADTAAQKAATADPLTMVRIDPEAQPEPAPFSRQVALSQVQWPVMPDLDAARADKREVVISGQGEQREVLVRTPDTDDQQVYTFAARPCWTLTKVDDQAL